MGKLYHGGAGLQPFALIGEILPIIRSFSTNSSLERYKLLAILSRILNLEFRMKFVRVILALSLVGALVAMPALSQGLDISGLGKSRNAIFKSQSKLLDGKLSKQYSGSVKLTPNYQAGGAIGIVENTPPYRGSYKGEYLQVAKQLARKHGVPEDLFLRLVQQESGWNPSAVSHKGATGLAQLMPATARSLGVNINDPHQNLEGGVRYLKMMHSKFGNWRLALAAYNAGPGAVEKYGDVPPYAETKAYVKAILG